MGIWKEVVSWIVSGREIYFSQPGGHVGGKLRKIKSKNPQLYIKIKNV